MVLSLTQPPLFSQIGQGSNALSSYTLNGSNWYVTQLSDLNTASLPSTITNDPNKPITAIKSCITGSPITTIPASFFGAHVAALNLANGGTNLATLYTSGVRMFRLRDTFCSLGDGTGTSDGAHVEPTGMVYNCSSGITFTAGSTNTVNWTLHGLSNATAQGTSAYPGVGAGSGFFVGGTSLPSGLTAYQLYYVVNATTNTFQLSNSIGGSAISLGSVGSGTFYGFGINLGISNPLAKNGLLDYMTINTTTGAFTGGRSGRVLFDCSTPPASMSGTNSPGQVLATWSSSYNAFITQLWNYIYKYYGSVGGTDFEVWNEPNNIPHSTVQVGDGFTNAVSIAATAGNALYQYAAAIYAAVHSNSYTTGWNAKVVSPSWTNLYPNNYYTITNALIPWLLSSQGNGISVTDIIGFHNYGESNYPRASMNVMIKLAAALSSNSLASSSYPIYMTEGGDCQPSQAILWRTHILAAALGFSAYFHYDYDLSAGAYNPNLPNGTSSQQLASPWTPDGTNYYSWPGVANGTDPASAYRAMISACAGKSCSYVNLSNGYQIGTQINGVSYLW